jgi:hypothetical protein
LTEGLATAEEKYRALFRWVATNIRYDTVGYKSGNYGDLYGACVEVDLGVYCSVHGAMLSIDWTDIFLIWGTT